MKNSPIIAVDTFLRGISCENWVKNMGTFKNDAKFALTGKGLLVRIITGLTNSLVYSEAFKNAARKRPADFTRDRKMTFEEVVLFMLTSAKCSTQCSLRRFFAALGKEAMMKQQSFSEARAKINVSAFVQLFQLTVGAMTENLQETWEGYLVYAIDGSKIALPADKGLLAHFGPAGRGGTSPTAQASILYDVPNDIVVDALIGPMSVDERTMASRHVENCKNFAQGAGKLFIFDRGYPSFELVEELEGGGFSYVMRVRSKFSVEIDAQAAPDGYAWLEQGGKRIKLRVVKFDLDSGMQETLITNLTDKNLDVAAFKKLYFMRWPVETKYDVVKNKLQLENFTSRTVEGVEQDFYAAMYLTNVAAAAASDAQAEIDEAREGKNNKYRYKANLNEAIGVLKDRLILALAEDSPRKQAKLIQKIIDEVTRSVTPIRGDRSVPRSSSSRKCKFHHNRKANC